VYVVDSFSAFVRFVSFRFASYSCVVVWPSWSVCDRSSPRSSNVWLTYQDPIWPDALQFPGQPFFMTNGPWMSLEMYAIQAAITVGLGVWLARQLSAAEDRARAQPALPKRLDSGAVWTQPSVLVDAAFRSVDQ